jgi:hypothetical protein
MTYEIIYVKDNEQHTLEWITASDWSQSQVVECFERRNPTAEVLVVRLLQPQW